MELPELPDDLIAPILAFLDGHDIVQLSRIGSVRLHAKVKRNARNWRIECGRFSLFPFSVYDAPDLVSLDVYLAGSDHKYALDFGNRTLPPLVIQNCLISLHFSFPNCLTVLEDSRLLKRAPNLQNLACRDYYSAFKISYLKNLPLNLKKLHLESITRDPPVPFSVYDLASLLPVSIESVNLPSVSVQVPPENKDSATLKWPQNLKSLSANRLPVPFIIDHGPPLIEELKGIAYWDIKDSEIFMSRIPKTMKQLDLVCFAKNSVRLRVILDSAMPPLMRSLGLPLAPIPYHDLEETFLTPTLTFLESFDELQSSFPNMPFRTLLPNIQEVNTCLADEIMLAMVPLNAKIISTRVPLSNALISQLPHTLTTLKCHIVPNWSFEVLPRTVTQLLVRSPGNQLLDPFPASQWRLLPPHLVYLCMDLIMLATASCLAEIPAQKLKELNFEATSPSKFKDPSSSAMMILENYKEKVLQDKTLIQYLPTELDIFEMNLANTECEWVCWTNDLAKYLPKLTGLGITRRYVSEIVQDPPAEEFLGNLPPLLKTLIIQIDPTLPLPMDVFSKLPKQLRTLSFILRKTVGDGAESLLRNEHFAHLPRLLSSLSFQMPQYLSARQSGFAIHLESKLTPEIVSQLPPFLTSFPFGHIYNQVSLWKEAWKLYNTPQKWFGCPPEQEN